MTTIKKNSTFLISNKSCDTSVWRAQSFIVIYMIIKRHFLLYKSLRVRVCPRLICLLFILELHFLTGFKISVKSGGHFTFQSFSIWKDEPLAHCPWSFSCSQCCKIDDSFWEENVCRVDLYCNRRIWSMMACYANLNCHKLVERGHSLLCLCKCCIS